MARMISWIFWAFMTLLAVIEGLSVGGLKGIFVGASIVVAYMLGGVDGIATLVAKDKETRNGK